MMKEKTHSRQRLTVAVAMTLTLLSTHAAAFVKKELSGPGSGAATADLMGSRGTFFGDHFPSGQLNRVYGKGRRDGSAIRGDEGDRIVGWRSLNVTLGKRPEVFTGGQGAVAAGGSAGITIPHIQHPVVSELNYSGASGLTFEAWVRDPVTDFWYESSADNKPRPSDTQSQRPEPTGWLLLAMGLYGLFAAQRARRDTPALERIKTPRV